MTDEQTTEGRIDVFLATAKKRLWGALYQAHAVLSNPHNIRLTIGMDGDWPELESRLNPIYGNRVRWMKTAPTGKMTNPMHEPEGYGGSPNLLRCLQTLSWRDWFYVMPDDDCTMPWAFDHFTDALDDNLGMIVGQAVPVSRHEHMDFSPYTVGRSLRRCRISLNCVLLNIRKIETLTRPYFDPRSAYADWEFIDRVARNFRVKFIRSVVSMFALCELPQLPPDMRMNIETFASIERRAVPC